MSKIEKISDLQFFKDNCADKATDGRAVTQCIHCKKSKHHTKMSSKFTCVSCAKARKKNLKKVRAATQAARRASLKARTYPLSQPWANLANVVGKA